MNLRKKRNWGETETEKKDKCSEDTAKNASKPVTDESGMHIPDASTPKKSDSEPIPASDSASAATVTVTTAFASESSSNSKISGDELKHQLLELTQLVEKQATALVELRSNGALEAHNPNKIMRIY